MALPLADLKPGEAEDMGALQEMVSKSYPNLDEDIAHYVGEIVKTAPFALKLGLKKTPPEDRARLRDLIIRTVLGKVEKALNEIDYDEYR